MLFVFSQYHKLKNRKYQNKAKKEKQKFIHIHNKENLCETTKIILSCEKGKKYKNVSTIKPLFSNKLTKRRYDNFPKFPIRYKSDRNKKQNYYFKKNQYKK